VQLTDEEREFIGPYLPIGAHGPYPERLRQQFEGVIWRFKTGGQWRGAPGVRRLVDRPQPLPAVA
jgi:transposase